MRQRYTHVTVMAGCFTCNGSDALWLTRNAMALAAKHADTTGHETWADQVLQVRYKCEAA